jgi:hypothetical protein
MQLARSLALATWIAGSTLFLPLAACGGSVSQSLGALDAGESTVQGPSGSVSVEMQLPVGSLISMASYTLTGRQSFYRSSMLNFPSTRDVAFGIAQVPAQDGYNLDVTLTSPDGSNVCTSSGQFGVDASTTATVVLIPHCSQTSPQPAPTSVLQLTVDLPPGISIPSLAFSLAGADGFRMHDSWNVTNDSALLFVVQNIPASTGDAIALSATTSDGAEACTAGTTLNFAPNATTEATLVLQCQGVAGGADP